MSPKFLAKLKSFDSLPDDALVPDAVACVIIDCSLATLKQKNPVPARRITEGRHGRRVGDIRKLVRGELQPTA